MPSNPKTMEFCEQPYTMRIESPKNDVSPAVSYFVEYFGP
jgi:hypothetical protein